MEKYPERRETIAKPSCSTRMDSC